MAETCIDSRCTRNGRDAAVSDARTRDVPSSRDVTRIDVNLPDAPSDVPTSDSSAPDVVAVDSGPPVPHVVFVSSEQFDAAMGGIAGADATCARLAMDAGLMGVYRALMSTTGFSARDRLGLRGPVHNVEGQIIAAGPEELWGGSIRRRIDLTERAGPPEGYLVWTGTDADGSIDERGDTCGDWASTAGAGETGRTDRMDSGWVSIYGASGSSNACSNPGHLYCVSVN